MPKFKCPSCDTYVTQSDNFCPECGTEFKGEVSLSDGFRPGEFLEQEFEGIYGLMQVLNSGDYSEVEHIYIPKKLEEVTLANFRKDKPFIPISIGPVSVAIYNPKTRSIAQPSIKQWQSKALIKKVNGYYLNSKANVLKYEKFLKSL